MNKLTTALLLTLLTLAIRVLTVDLEYANISYDAANHLWGTHEYSIAAGQPHLPGYYLYIAAINGLGALTGSMQSAIILLSVLCTSLATGLFYLFLRKFWPQRVAVAFAILLAVNPVVWVYGIVSDIYAVDLFISLAMVLALTSGRWIYLSPLIFTLALGVRPTSPLLLIPIYLYCWYMFSKTDRFTWRFMVTAHCVGIGVLAAWVLPMLDSVGGLSAYMDLYRTNTPLPRTSFTKNLIRAGSHHVLFVLVLFPFIAYFFVRRSSGQPLVSERKRAFILLSLLWLVPAFLSFWLFLYNKGYGLLYMAPLLGLPLWLNWKSQAALLKVTGVAIVVSLCLFFRPIAGPSPEFLFSPDYGAISLRDVYIDRMNLQFALGYFSVDYFADGYREVHEEIEQRKASGIKVTSMFVDPSSNLVGRTMYFQHPEIIFSDLMVEAKLVTHSLWDWKSHVTPRTDSLLASSIVISEKQFFNKYLADLNLPHTARERLVFYTADSAAAAEIFARYTRYFLRP